MIMVFTLDGIEKRAEQKDPKRRIKGYQLREMLKLPRGMDLYVEDDLSEDGDRQVGDYELIRLHSGMRFTTLEPDR
jgi:hypothetical protein